MERSLPLGYLLWFLWGLFGVHKFYLGKPLWGFVYFLTGGLIGLGWLADLFLLPRQFRRFRERQRGCGWIAAGADTGEDGVRRTLLTAAQRHRGLITVTEAVMESGLPFHTVQDSLSTMLESGLVGVRNHPGTGAVQYVFFEMNEPEQ